MKSCNVLIECATEEELERFATVVRSYEDGNHFRFKPVCAIGKQEAFEIFTRHDGDFEVIFTQVTPNELTDSNSFIMRHGNDFEKRTGGVLSLQFAYQLKDMNPFVNIVMAGELAEFDERELFRLMMRGSKIGVETFAQMPKNGDPMMEALLDNLKAKVIYEKKIRKPIRDYMTSSDCI